jgi:Domain of unknown function (DUF4290)
MASMMEYNTTRSKLLMPEYGRNVQKMIEYLLKIDDRAKRLRNAEIIIELMGTLNPHLKSIEDYKHKLWDHLYQMTDFKLDVDSPYPRPTAEEIFKKPERLPYPQSGIKHRHLGKNLINLMDKALAETNEEKIYGLTQAVGYYMKLAYANWHKEPVHDDMIKSEMNVITGGRLQYETGGYRVPYEPPASNNNRNNGGGFKPKNKQNFKGNNPNSHNGGGNNSRNNFGSNNFGTNSFGGGGFGKNKKFKKK